MSIFSLFKFRPLNQLTIFAIRYYWISMFEEKKTVKKKFQPIEMELRSTFGANNTLMDFDKMLFFCQFTVTCVYVSSRYMRRYNGLCKRIRQVLRLLHLKMRVEICVSVSSACLSEFWLVRITKIIDYTFVDVCLFVCVGVSASLRLLIFSFFFIDFHRLICDIELLLMTYSDINKSFTFYRIFIRIHLFLHVSYWF